MAGQQGSKCSCISLFDAGLCSQVMQTLPLAAGKVAKEAENWSKYSGLTCRVMTCSKDDKNLPERGQWLGGSFTSQIPRCVLVCSSRFMNMVDSEAVCLVVVYVAASTGRDLQAFSLPCSPGLAFVTTRSLYHSFLTSCSGGPAVCCCFCCVEHTSSGRSWPCISDDIQTRRKTSRS